MEGFMMKGLCLNSLKLRYSEPLYFDHCTFAALPISTNVYPNYQGSIYFQALYELFYNKNGTFE